MGRHAQGLLSVLTVLKLHGSMTGYQASKFLPAWYRSVVYRRLALLVKYKQAHVYVDGAGHSVYGLGEKA